MAKIEVQGNKRITRAQLIIEQAQAVEDAKAYQNKLKIQRDRAIARAAEEAER